MHFRHFSREFQNVLTKDLNQLSSLVFRFVPEENEKSLVFLHILLHKQ